ncbi:type IX secretion system membrane protein PorP/SprF [uncultured Croceitalea sp.]|uniref:PorP/SprF family type IX secretion system membrane protein n=1 Tax=uncultured Croceitalea sp. TaxID=1798908 RepID=UPI00374FCC55
MRKIQSLIILLLALLCSGIYAQEENPFLTYEAPSQNLIKFNRFLINPTFSTVREDKSYINLFHRNQSVSFDDNNQTYYLSYSGRIGDRSGLGVSLYTQREGLFSNVGLLANYAYGIKLSEKSNFTFGANFSYYTSGFDQDRANTLDPDDVLLNSLDDSSLISFQPGFNISYGKFDFGVFAENLFDYNLKTSESNTEFNEKTYSGHLQYTHQFKNASGILESGRLMPLARVKRIGEDGYTLGGNLILDLPKLGWLQAGYDDFYGAAAGIGFNLTKNISLGYTIEKGINNDLRNFGTTHEISLAYSFTPNLTEDRVMLEKDNEDLVVNDEPEIDEISLTEKDALIADLQQKLAENDAILDELLLRQDSIEKTREADLERRFNMVMRMVQRETNGNTNLKDEARKAYFQDSDSFGIANNTNTNNPISNQGITSAASTKKVISLKKPKKETSIANRENTVSTTSEKDAISLKNNKRKNTSSIAAATEKPSSIAKDKIYKPKTVTSSKKINSRLKAFDIPDVESGYYIVANVYNGEKYMNSFMRDLESQGHTADYLENPRNGRKYVYLKKFKTKQEAINAYASKMDGSYNKDMWVMKVKGTDNAYTDLANNDSKYGSNTLQKNIVENNKQNPSEVTTRTYNLNGVGSGYYIIANVFANTSNANRFVKKLNAQGLNAGYFINPENNYKYVYLKKHETWNNALVSYYDRLDSAYDDKMWIMRVKPNSIS